MATWNACDESANCHREERDEQNPPGNPPGATQVSISRSVGQGGANLRDDVISIQDALNRVPPSEGGANPPLKVDGLCWQRTTSAIYRFQTTQFPGLPADARVDPGQRTLNRLNALLGGGAGNPEPRGVEFAYQSIPDARDRINRAIVRLTTARSFFALPSPLFDPVNERRAAEWHFKVHKADSPVAQIDRVRGIYDRMNQTLFMAARKETNFRLFQPARESENAVAWAEFDGYDFALDELTTPPDPPKVSTPGAYIYVHPRRQAGSLVIIHELGHYCGGRRGSGQENMHMANPYPLPRGRAMEGPRNYADMTPDEAFRNTYSYQAFAFPDREFGRVPDQY